MSRFVFLSLLVVGAAGRAIRSSSNPDEVLSLPGWTGPLPSRIFSGYLNITSTKHLHYILVESEKDPENDPVVVWYNGGPGCSSLDGFIYEHGPFTVDPLNYGQLRLRPIHWSQIANVLYIEAPVGVGFSYSDDPNQDYTVTDDTTAADNLLGIEKFYELYPYLVDQDLFLTGESYAGIYVPTLAEAIMQATDEGTYKGGALKGIAVGNGCSGNQIGICSFGPKGTYYEWKYLMGTAFVSDDLKDNLTTACNWTDIRIGNFPSADCQNVIDIVSDEIGHINLYNVYGDCVSGSMEQEEGVTYHAKVPRHTLFKLGGPDACIDSRAASGYLNQPEVITALHVQAPTTRWVVCGTPSGWNYTSTRPNLPRDTYPALIRRYRILIFNGDWDACVPYTDNESWTEAMGLRPEKPWHVWTYTTPEGLTGQVGGYAVKYTVPAAQPDSWFRFITVRGGRHEVPESVPDKALSMLSRLINNGDF